MADKYDALKLDNQLCFPLYACAKEVVRRYKPFLDEVDLTYTQYITMMVMWEHRKMSVKDIGKILFLDSGTLTPVLKTLEKKGFIKRHRSEDDERVLDVLLTEEGLMLREQCVDIPAKVGSCINLDMQEAAQLYMILHKMMSGTKDNCPL